jgi:hypothetical protein
MNICWIIELAFVMVALTFDRDMFSCFVCDGKNGSDTCDQKDKTNFKDQSLLSQYCIRVSKLPIDHLVNSLHFL